jgi:hypothetical protein
MKGHDDSLINSYDPTMDSYIQNRNNTSLFKAQKRSAAVSTSLEVESRSHYQRMPTENFKFERFIELLFKSRISSEEVKVQIIKYV